MPESLTSTREQDFQRVGQADFYQSSPAQTSVPPLVLVQGGNATRLSRNGKIPRTVTSAQKERSDTGFRSRMQDARVKLAADFYSSEFESLAALRLARGYSQHQLAAAVGSTQPHIAKIEAGNTNIYFATAKNIADALGVSLDKFYAILNSQAELTT